MLLDGLTRYGGQARKRKRRKPASRQWNFESCHPTTRHNRPQRAISRLNQGPQVQGVPQAPGGFCADEGCMRTFFRRSERLTVANVVHTFARSEAVAFRVEAALHSDRRGGSLGTKIVVRHLGRPAWRERGRDGYQRNRRLAGHVVEVLTGSPLAHAVSALRDV